MGVDLSASEEMVLVGSRQNCTTIAPKESPVKITRRRNVAGAGLVIADVAYSGPQSMADTGLFSSAVELVN